MKNKKIKIELTEEEIKSLPELMQWINKRKAHYFQDVIFSNFEWKAPEQLVRHERCVQMMNILEKEETMLMKIIKELE